MAQRRFEIKQVRTWPQGGFVQMARSDTEWWQIPEKMEATVELGDYRVELVTGLDSTLSPTITKMTIERESDGPPLSDLVRGPWERVLSAVVDRVATRWERDAQSDRWVAKDYWGEGIPGAASIVITRGRRSRAGAEQIEREIARVIELWPEAQRQAAPIEFLREQLGVSRRTTQRRVEKAVERMSQEES